MENNTPEELGVKLKELRNVHGFTLRQVEEAAGISNSYLSQLESCKIKMPSVTVLYKLSKLYAVELSLLLYYAGIVPERPDLFDKVLNLTSEEEKEMIRYLAFLRNKNKINGKKNTSQNKIRSLHYSRAGNNKRS